MFIYAFCQEFKSDYEDKLFEKALPKLKDSRAILSFLKLQKSPLNINIL